MMCNEREKFNAITTTIETALWWNGQEIVNGNLVWVSTEWAMGVIDG